MAATCVLLVDNIPDHAEQYETALTDRGYRVHVATSGLQALTIARDARPACIVIDVRLPDMSGWDLCAALKREEATRESAVIILTPDTSRAHALESARVHCNAWIAQPVQAQDLTRVVGHVLSQEDNVPATIEEAVLGVTSCPVCESDRVRATLRVSPIQYYSCRACGHGWRVEAL
ncbi:MAG: response regulator [Steroidobacteraceae bacterium]